MRMPSLTTIASSRAGTPNASRRGLRLLPLLALLCALPAAHAQAVVGTVTHLSGLLTAQRADGGTKLIAVQSALHEGETLVTAADTYVEVQFVDDATIMLGPQSQLKIARYTYDPEHPATDRVLFDFLKGSLQSTTGKLGHRNHDAISFRMPDGSELKVHGTTFSALYTPAGAPPGPSQPTLAPGLYVQVLDGQIAVTNKGGAQNFSAGQFGFTPSATTPPVLLPKNPGIQFTPPPVFNSPSSAGTTSSSATKAGTVDCVVQ
jgi:hypothetical protein